MTLVEKIQDCIDKWDIVGLNSEVHKEENKEWIENNAWDIVPVLVIPATEENLTNCPQIVHGCSKILADPISKLGNPKELLITLLEHCEHSGSTIKLVHCLPAIEQCLIRLEIKAALKCWDWALETVIGHVTNLDLPISQELEDDERWVLENEDYYSKHVTLVQETTQLLEALNSRLNKFEDERVGQLKCCLIKNSVKLLAKPLAFLNVAVSPNGVPTSAKITGTKLCTIISALSSNYVQLVNLQEFFANYSKEKLPNIDDSEKKSVMFQWSLGIGTLFYIHFQDGLYPIPACYNPVYLFNLILPILLNMLNFAKGQTPSPYFCQEKGLFLSRALMMRVSKNSVPEDVFEDEKHTEYMAQLQQIIVYHSMEGVRKLAFENYNRYFDTFGMSSKALSKLVEFVFAKANHSGLIGHAIGKLKDHLLRIMKEQLLPKEFEASNLHTLIKKFCKLANGAETDLLEVSDEVMASLNFLICIILRDSKNILSLNDILSDIQKTFLEPLKKGLDMSRAHYKLKLEETTPNNPESGSEVTLMVGGQPLPEMSKEQMKEVIHSALNTFDMMECVLCQLNDVMSRKF